MANAGGRVGVCAGPMERSSLLVGAKRQNYAEGSCMGSYKAKRTSFPQLGNPTTRHQPKKNESRLPQKDVSKQLFHYSQNPGAILHSSTGYFLAACITVGAVLYPRGEILQRNEKGGGAGVGAVPTQSQQHRHLPRSAQTQRTYCISLDGTSLSLR